MPRVKSGPEMVTLGAAEQAAGATR